MLSKNNAVRILIYFNFDILSTLILHTSVEQINPESEGNLHSTSKVA